MQNDELVTNGPCWVDLATTDAASATTFYTGLFGWRAEADPRPEAGGRTVLSHSAGPVAALVPQLREGAPPAWLASFLVESADAAAARVRAAGGTVQHEPRDVLAAVPGRAAPTPSSSPAHTLDAPAGSARRRPGEPARPLPDGRGTPDAAPGRFAVASDPSGALFGLWQAGGFAGAAVVNRPNSLGWVELHTRDVAACTAFYPKVFGWSVSAGEHYTRWGLHGAHFGGMARIDEHHPAGTGPHWLPYFAVADVDATVNKAVGHGAERVMGPFDVPDVPDGPRIAVLRDRQGAAFGVYLAGTER